jgi:hypothetical protein
MLDRTQCAAYTPVVERARALAAEAGVADRVSFAVLDAAAGLRERFDVITTFDVLHDASTRSGCSPRSTMRSSQVGARLPRDQLRRPRRGQRRPDRRAALRGSASCTA